MNGTPPPLPAARSRPALPSGAVWLSAVVPGLGQLAQRRWIAGVLFLATSLGLFLWLGWMLVHSMVENIRTALAFADGTDPARPFDILSIPLVLGLLALFLVVYSAALIDAHLAATRIARRRGTAKTVDSGHESAG